MINVLFVGSIYSDCLIELFKKNSKRGFQFAAQNLQESLIEGFSKNSVNLSVLSIPSLSTFPRSYKSPIVPNGEFIIHEHVLGKSIGYTNLPFMRFFLRNTDKIIETWYHSTNGKKIIFVYGMHEKLMRIALKAKVKYLDVELAIIVPDLPQYFGWNKYLKLLRVDRRTELTLKKLIVDFDKVIVLSKHMLEDLKLPSSIKTCVMEGIFSPANNVSMVNKDSNKVILYTGNISKRYGIELLLKAFSKIKDSNYRLWIRGNGDMIEFVKQAILVDSRISYLPPQPKNKLIELQKKATILVNPVSPKLDFTKYFFPSKTMDYLASGTPTIMYNLECLPEEYKPHLFFFKGETPDQVAEDLVNVCNLSEEELLIKGSRAQKFIFEEKNAKKQVLKILNILN